MEKFGLKILLCAYGTFIFSSGILIPIYAFFVQRIGGGIFEASSTIGISYMLTGLVAMLIYQTKWGSIYQKECLLVGWFFWLISICLYCYVTNISTLLLSQCFGGLGNALSTSAYDAEFSKQASNNFVHGWSRLEGTSNISAGLAALSGGIIVNYFGFDILMLFMTCMATLSFLCILFYVSREKALINQKLRSTKNTLPETII